MKWAEIRNTDDVYEVSDTGRVRKAILKHSGRAFKHLALTRTPQGYITAALRVRGAFKGYRVHRLVFEAFVGPIPAGKQVNHINSRRDDNRLSNLEAVTPCENVRHGLMMRDRKLPKNMRFRTAAELGIKRIFRNAISAPGIVRLANSFQITTFERYARKLGLKPVIMVGDRRAFYKPDALKVIRVINRLKRSKVFSIPKAA
jgi:hypothetical protein